MATDTTSEEQWTVEKALQDAGLEERETASLITFFRLAGRLKKTQREGWKKFSIDPESVADHSFRMTTMALVSCPEGTDRDRCLQMCLVHDIAESLVGDITPLNPMPRAEKFRREALVVDYVAETLGLTQVKALWREFEDGQTPEARFAGDLDKLEMVLQAQEYERQHPDKDLSEFFGVVDKLRTDRGKELARDIVGDRKIELSPETKRLHDKYYG